MTMPHLLFLYMYYSFDFLTLDVSFCLICRIISSRMFLYVTCCAKYFVDFYIKFKILNLTDISNIYFWIVWLNFQQQVVWKIASCSLELISKFSIVHFNYLTDGNRKNLHANLSKKKSFSQTSIPNILQSR